jgi:hypothetical protein
MFARCRAGTGVMMMLMMLMMMDFTVACDAFNA